MRSRIGNFAAISGLLLSFPGIIGCSLAAPSDQALMGKRGEPTPVPPEPPFSDGLVFWLDGATEVETVDESGTPRVSRWGDLSGNGHEATQADAELRPAWIEDRFANRRALVFDPTDKLAIADIPLEAGGFTLLLLAQPQVYAATDAPVAFGADGPRLAGEDDTDLSFRITEVDMNANDIDAPFAWVPGRAALTIARLDSEGLASVRVDGHEVLETRSVAPLSGSFEVSVGNASVMIAVVGLYDHALTLDELVKLEQTVGERWACCKP